MRNHFLEMMYEKTLLRVKSFSTPIETLRRQALKARVPHDFLGVFLDHTAENLPHIIAEIKFASPSRGNIAVLKDPIEVARQYLHNGAHAISILTEPDYFKGSFEYLKQVRAAFPEARLLMKDFNLDESQLLMARIIGADAVLLNVNFLDFVKLKELYAIAMELKLTPLVEVHTLEELEIAYSIGARLIGVNNRNLKTLSLDLSISKDLIQHAIPSCVFISESGFKSGREVQEFQALGYSGFLIGSHFMKHAHPGESLRILREEYHDES